MECVSFRVVWRAFALPAWMKMHVRTSQGPRVRASIEGSGNLFFKPARVSFSPALHGSVKMQAAAGSFVGKYSRSLKHIKVFSYFPSILQS